MRRGSAKHTNLAGIRLSAVMTGISVVLLPAASFAASFSVMSYNVRGLPPQVIEDRHTEIGEIAPLLEDYHTPAPPYVGMDAFVGLQEVFYQDYYNTLTDPQTVSYAYITAKDNGGLTNIGDGLTNLSDFPITGFTRTQWDDCFGTIDNGSDCGTNKGFTYSKVFLEENVSVDVYTLHADAGQDSGSREARRKNILQLVDAINANSAPTRPLIVLGDTNSLYTRLGNDNIQELLNGTGVKDVWVELRRSGIVPTAGAPIDTDCPTDPGGANCELVDKIFYRDGTVLALAPQSYDALKEMFSDGDGELSDHTPITVTFDYAVLTTTTTTTTTSSTSTSTSTSTTLPVDRPCGDPIALVANTRRANRLVAGGVRAVVASDALFVLKAAVGTLSCQLCTCDVDNSTKITATDALRVLKKAVGQDITLTCPPCI